MTKFDNLIVLEYAADISIDEIDVGERFDRQSDTSEHIEDLSAAIKEQGLRKPIEVEKMDDGNYVLISGLSRLTAVKKLKKTTIRADVYAKMDDVTRHYMIVEENLRRKNYSPEERTHIFLKLVYEEIRASGIDSSDSPFVPTRIASAILSSIKMVDGVYTFSKEKSATAKWINIFQQTFEKSKLYTSPKVLQQELLRYDLPTPLYKIVGSYPTRIISEIKGMCIKYKDTVFKDNTKDMLVRELEQKLLKCGPKGPTDTEFKRIKKAVLKKCLIGQQRVSLAGDYSINMNDLDFLFESEVIGHREKKKLLRLTSQLQTYIAELKDSHATEARKKSYAKQYAKSRRKKTDD